MAFLSRLRALADRVDRFQQRHPVLAFPVAVFRELQDMKAGYLGAILTFFAFVSLFPLLLILTTVLGAVLRSNPKLQQDVLNSALVDFPVIGDQLKNNIHDFGRSGPALAISIVFTSIGALGLANAAQYAMNLLWGVPEDRRPKFPQSWLRSVGIIGTMGLGVLSTTAMTALGEWASGAFFPAGLRLALVAASFVLTALLFWLGMRSATAIEVEARDLRLAAILTTVFWQGLQYLGGFIAAHQLAHASTLYGVFGLVLGLVAWIYLQARLTLIAVTTDVVRARRSWPRSLFD
ncbi:YihY/virulence factor BrkB family protein [Catenulispora pinisilvae]|uniref:YihY/virulence factor BrkB family protein n=1 Tax=Catenulispora pinisilvae TaxID=2705253 RepID=UPI001E2A919E|nr:YihY/virulence factor BrkB family protein [Catenulispora pinisilvae]